MTPEERDLGRIGVELMTAWLAGDGSNELFGARLDAVLKDTHLEESHTLLISCLGVAEVAGCALTLLSQVTGKPAQEWIQEIAKAIESPPAASAG